MWVIRREQNDELRMFVVKLWSFAFILDQLVVVTPVELVFFSLVVVTVWKARHWSAPVHTCGVGLIIMHFIPHLAHSSSQIKPNSSSPTDGESLSLFDLASHSNSSRGGGNRGGHSGKVFPSGRGGGRVGCSGWVGFEVCGGSNQGGSITGHGGCTPHGE